MGRQDGQIQDLHSKGVLVRDVHRCPVSCFLFDLLSVLACVLDLRDGVLDDAR